MVQKAVQEDVADGYVRGSMRIKPRQLAAMTEVSAPHVLRVMDFVGRHTVRRFF